MEIYGYLPIWVIARALELNFIQTLNLSLWLFLLLLFFISKNIIEEIRDSKLTNWDLCFLTIFCTLSPIVFNRIYSGHINLLFGMFPSLIIVLCLLSFRYQYLFIGFICLIHAFSIQGYQLIIYNIFYIPIFILFAKKYPKDRNKKIFSLALIVLISLVLSLPSLIPMISYAFSSDNVRKVGSNVVYSYLKGDYLDLPNFLFSTRHFFTNLKPGNFFHELNYPFIGFFIWMLYDKKNRDTSIAFGITFITCLFFAFDLFPLKFLSEIPVLSSFRVPQRAFIFPSLLISIIAFAYSNINFKREDLFFLFGLLFLSIFLEGIEVVYALLGVFTLSYLR